MVILCTVNFVFLKKLYGKVDCHSTDAIIIPPTIYYTQGKNTNNRISGIIVSVLALSVVDCGFEPCSDETKEYTIAICCFSAKHAPLRNKSQDWLARNQNNMFE